MKFIFKNNHESGAIGIEAFALSRNDILRFTFLMSSEFSVVILLF